MPPVDEEAEQKAKHWQAVAFRFAVETGDMEVINQQLEEGFQPTYKMTDDSNWTVLMIAAQCGQLECAEKFTKGGKMPKVEDKDPNGFQALMLAALNGHKDICQLLIDKKAGVNEQDNTGDTALMKASAEGHLECVKLLLAAGADPDAEDCNGMSAIKKAASWGRVDVLLELLPKVKDDARQRKHCLLFGRLNGHEEVIKEMTKILEPESVVAEAVEDAEGAVVEAPT